MNYPHVRQICASSSPFFPSRRRFKSPSPPSMDLFEAQSKAASGDRSELQDSTPTATEAGNRNMPTPAPKSSPPAPAPPQLIMFYGGSVSVYDDVPPEKAQAIMLLAAATAVASRVAANKTTAVAANTKAPVVVGAAAAPASPAPVLTRTLSFLSSSAATDSQPAQPQLTPNSGSSLCKLQAELPIARRHSLQRFLEKRRDRVVSKAPYASGKPSDSIEVASEGQGQPQLM